MRLTSLLFIFEDLDDGDDDDDDEPLEVAKPPKKGKRKSSEDLDFSETLGRSFFGVEYCLKVLNSAAVVFKLKGQ